jgi:hypothetical protein
MVEDWYQLWRHLDARWSVTAKRWEARLRNKKASVPTLVPHERRHKSPLGLLGNGAETDYETQIVGHQQGAATLTACRSLSISLSIVERRYLERGGANGVQRHHYRSESR